MKKELQIPTKTGFCKNCFRIRRHASAYCGECQNEPERKKIYIDDQKNFPLLKEAKKIFPISENTILTYGDTIYFDRELPYHLVAHEITHCFQQEGQEKEWWQKYFKDNKFRLKQEAEAYHNQYECVKRIDFLKAEKLLQDIASELSGKLYGEITSFEEAEDLIKDLTKNIK